MHQRELLGRRVSADDLFDLLEQLWSITESAGNRTESSGVFRMIPARIVTTTVGVRDEGDGHAVDRAYLTG